MPQPLEASLHAAQVAADVAIVGIPDSHFGECISVVIVKDPTHCTPTLRQLQQIVEREHGHHAIPRSLFVADEFPRTGSGKLNRNELKNQIMRGELAASS